LTIITSLLNNNAKAMGGESYDYPTHNLVATGDNSSIDLDATALDGEIGTRELFTIARSDNVTNYTVVRSGTDVIDTTNGDSLTGAGMEIAATGNDLQVGVTINELQTTAFDLELDYEIKWDRG